MNTPTADEAAIIQRGAVAEEFLRNPAFASAINELSDHLGNAILLSEPGEATKRERLYHIHTALKELVGILQARISAKASVESSLSEPTENE